MFYMGHLKEWYLFRGLLKQCHLFRNMLGTGYYRTSHRMVLDFVASDWVLSLLSLLSITEGFSTLLLCL